ncbi:MAG: hypothetical protein Q3972_06140 [Corynebacterium sp.]|nr:hypothetical protein [Corynebacterium sp.]
MTAPPAHAVDDLRTSISNFSTSWDDPDYRPGFGNRFAGDLKWAAASSVVWGTALPILLVPTGLLIFGAVNLLQPQAR